MKPDIADRIRSYSDGFTVASRPPVDRIVRRANKRRLPALSGGAPAAVALAVCVVLVAVLGWGPYGGSTPAPTGAPPGGRATLPDHFAHYSYLTADVSKSPPGRAIAIYQHGYGVELFDFPQALVVGADSDVYRRVDLAEDRGGNTSQSDPAPMALSPDGSLIAIGSYIGAGDLALLDLETGQTTRLPAAPGAKVVPLAFSPDGRHLAAAEVGGDLVADPTPGPGGPLVLYDLVRGGEPVRVPEFTYVRQVAFSPDGSELAVAGSDGLHLPVIDLDGRTLRTLSTPAGFDMNSNAWSPDGRVLALRGSSSSETSAPIEFVDATGTGALVPASTMVGGWGRPLAWTGPDTLLVTELEPPLQDTIITEVNVTTGERHRVSWIDGGPSANYMVSGLQLASGLLDGLRARPAQSPDRGPLPVKFRVLVIVAVAGLLGVVLLCVRYVRRRRPPRPRRRFDRMRGPLGSPTLHKG